MAVLFVLLLAAGIVLLFYGLDWLMTRRWWRREEPMPYDELKQYQWRRRQRVMAAFLRTWR